MQDFNDLIGLTIEQAQEKAKNRGVTRIRAKIVDGQPRMVTMDIQKTRLNVSLEDNKISAIGNFG